MNIEQVLRALTPDVYEKLKLAVEIGKWPDGRKLTAEQRGTCLQAVITYDSEHKPAAERVGFIAPKKHQHCGSAKGEVAEADKPLKWQH
mgnify:FL=1